MYNQTYLLMKKAVSIIALFAILLMTVSARTERLYQAAEGFKAPALTITESDSASGLSLAGLRGKYVLLNFWSSTDAQSRIQAKDYDLMAGEFDAGSFRHVAVNLDHSRGLFREIVRHDGLDANAQYFFADAANSGRTTDDWHLEKGLRSFLIDPQGRILAVNPSRETLRRIIIADN